VFGQGRAGQTTCPWKKKKNASYYYSNSNRSRANLTNFQYELVVLRNLPFEVAQIVASIVKERKKGTAPKKAVLLCVWAGSPFDLNAR
jgi:hypothetical protein